MIAIGKDLGLKRQESAPGIDKVYAGQAILERDFLGAQMLLDGDREVRAAFDCGVVGDDHRLVSLNDADSGDETRAGRFVVVHAVGGERAEFQKRCVFVNQRFNAVADKHLAPIGVPLDCRLAAAFLNSSELLPKLVLDRLDEVHANRNADVQ